MRPLLKAFKPTGLAVLVFVLLLVLQAALLSMYTGSSTFQFDGTEISQETSCVAFGAGAPIQIRSEGSKRWVEFHWGILLLNLAVCYVLSVALSALVVRMTRLHRPASVFLAAAAAVCLITFVASIIISRNYWGYYFSRPSLLAEADSISRVKAVIPVEIKKLDSGEHALVVDERFSLSEETQRAERESDNWLGGRILLHLKQKNLLPPAASSEPGDLAGLYRLIAASGLLAKSDDGYSSSDNLYGIVVDAVDTTGKRLVFVNISGAEVSNDHHPYYELLFRESADGRGLAFARGQRFFYDVAGIEGFEWYVFWIMLSAYGLVLGLPLLSITIGVWRAVRKPRSSRPARPPADLQQPEAPK